MFYSQQQQQAPQTPSPLLSLASKLHDHSTSEQRPGSGAGGGGNAWARHAPPSFNPQSGGGGGLPQSPGYNGLMGNYGPPPPQHHGGMHQHHQSFGGLHPGQGGMGGHQGMQGYGTMGTQGGSPPGRPAEPLSTHWQHQLMKAEASRQSASPHHRARSAAIASRMTNTKAAITILDPSSRSSASSNLQPHRKQTSLSITHDALSPEEDGGGTPLHPSATAAPAVTDDSGPSQPWTGLDLGGIRLKTLSPALFAFDHITNLFINHNNLTSLSPSISKLKHLTVLDATGNQLASVPPELGMLTRLKELLLFDNNLTDLPQQLGFLHQLETLGIDGNPLDERLRKIIQEEGTQGLIITLRESCPIGPEPPERQWLEIEPPHLADSENDKQESFTLLCYNILCERYATAATYGYTPGWALDWNYRKAAILQEVVNASADLVCLQEVDGEQYADFFMPRLKSAGYSGAYNPKTRARTMNSDEKKLVDGCATFWKDSKFQLIETQVIEFNQVALQKADMRTEDMFNRVMSKDNVAVVCSLECLASGSRLLLANAHIHWDPRYRDVKLVQVGMLIEELNKILDRFSTLPARLNVDPSYNAGRAPEYTGDGGRKIPLVICGDLNSVPHSAVYEFLATGDVPADHEDFMSHEYGQYTARGLKHDLGLKSVYSSIGELKMTNNTPSFAGTIDYIWYSTATLAVTSVLGEVDEKYLETTVGFPNAHFPSDHIPVFAQLRIKGRSAAPTSVVHHGYGGGR